MASRLSTKDRSLSYLLTPEARLNGFRLEEVGDHILHLYHHDRVVVRFLQSGVSIENILKEVSDIQSLSKN